MDREAWQPTVHGVTKSWTQLWVSDSHLEYTSLLISGEKELLLLCGHLFNKCLLNSYFAPNARVGAGAAAQ